MCEVRLKYFVMMTRPSTGYGPRVLKLFFNGEELKYELWEVKFLGYLRIYQHSISYRPRWSWFCWKKTKNATVFAELIQFLYDTSLTLVIREAQDNGRKALAILREHYLPKGKPKIVSLYTELRSLKKNSETTTEYIIRTEAISNSLKQAGEIISDGLLIAMVFKRASR